MSYSIAAWYFAHFAFVGLFIPFFPLYLENMGLNVAQIGAVVAAGQAMRIGIPSFWGWASDRVQRRIPLIRGSAALSIVVFAGFFHAQSFPALLIVTAMLYAAWSGAHPLVEALTFAHVRDAPSRYGRIRLWGSIGFVLAVLGGGSFLEGRPVAQLMWLVLACLVAVLLASLAMRETDSPGVVDDRPDSAPARTGAGGAARAVLLAAGLMALAHGPLYAFLSLYLGQAGYSRTAIGWLWALGVIAEIAVFIWQPRWSKIGSVRNVLLWCFVLAVLRFLLLAAFVEHVLIVAAAQLLHGATFGAHHVATASALNRWFPPHMQGRVQAVYGSFSFGAGGMLGAFLGGQIWQAWGSGATFLFAAGCALAGLLVIQRGLPKAGV